MQASHSLTLPKLVKSKRSSESSLEKSITESTEWMTQWYGENKRYILFIKTKPCTKWTVLHCQLVFGVVHSTNCILYLKANKKLVCDSLLSDTFLCGSVISAGMRGRSSFLKYHARKEMISPDTDTISWDLECSQKRLFNTQCVCASKHEYLRLACVTVLTLK